MNTSNSTSTNNLNLDFKLKTDADNELSDSGTNGTVYISMPDNISVEVYFETDSRQNINLISIGDCYKKANQIDEDYDYTLLTEHELVIRSIIDKFLSDNPVDCGEYQEYDTAKSLGFSNSDFLYGN